MVEETILGDGVLAEGVKRSRHVGKSCQIERIGNQPWSRDLYATVGAALVNEAKVKAIGYDYDLSQAVVAAAIQIHHFFVDGVIWKLRDARVGSFLSSSVPL